MLDKIEDPQNFGSIIRLAAALNIDGIIIEKKGQVPVNNTVIKVSSGGIAHVPVCQVSNLLTTIKELKKKFHYCLYCLRPWDKLDLQQSFYFNPPLCDLRKWTQRGWGTTYKTKRQISLHPDAQQHELFKCFSQCWNNLCPLYHRTVAKKANRRKKIIVKNKKSLKILKNNGTIRDKKNN